MRAYSIKRKIRKGAKWDAHFHRLESDPKYYLLHKLKLLEVKARKSRLLRDLTAATLNSMVDAAKTARSAWSDSSPTATT